MVKQDATSVMMMTSFVWAKSVGNSECLKGDKVFSSVFNANSFTQSQQKKDLFFRNIFAWNFLLRVNALRSIIMIHLAVLVFTKTKRIFALFTHNSFNLQDFKSHFV